MTKNLKLIKNKAWNNVFKIIKRRIYEIRNFYEKSK